MSNEVIWYDSSETGAPVLNNTAGAMLAVLDACLINGFNVKSVTSIVVASNVATVTCTAHGYSNAYGKLVKLAGATPAGLNGRKQITVVSANSFTFPTTGISDQTATGTIDARRAPLETWQKPYTGTNKAMYRSTDSGASGALLRVEDALSGAGCTATSARVRMVEAATDVDTFTVPCPTDAQITNGGYWTRGANTATAKTWRLVGDGRCFWFMTQLLTLPTLAAYLFGDFASYKPADSGAVSLVYSGSDPAGSTNANSSALDPVVAINASTLGVTTYPLMLRANNGVSSSVTFGVIPSISGMLAAFGSSTALTYPSPVDGGFVIGYPNMMLEPGVGLRGQLPGFAYPAANISATPDLTIYSGLANSSRQFVFMPVAMNTNVCSGLFDLTGPWR